MNHKGETYINDIDIWVEYKARLIGDSLLEVMKPSDTKELITNDFQTEDGVEIYLKHLRIKSRSFQLTYLLDCDSRSELLMNYKKFIELIYSGLLKLKFMPINTQCICIVEGCLTLDAHQGGNKAIVELKFNEPNPKMQRPTGITAFVLSNGDVALNNKEQVLTKEIS